MKLAIVQMKVCSDKHENIKEACSKISQCAEMGADMVMLPEMFVCPYKNDAFILNAEEENGYINEKMSKAAYENQIFLAAGSFPEKADGKLYNTSFVFGRDGNVIAKHRKIHLFDIAIDGGQHFCESDTFSPGNRYTVFDTPFGKMGLMICFDMRFPGLVQAMAQDGAKLILAPAEFNITTGPLHWDLLLRARAIDGGVWVAAASPARDENASYVAYGHSEIVSPWGNIVCRLSSHAEIMLCDIDMALSKSVQKQIPVLSAIRHDLY